VDRWTPTAGHRPQVEAAYVVEGTRIGAGASFAAVRADVPGFSHPTPPDAEALHTGDFETIAPRPSSLAPIAMGADGTGPNLEIVVPVQPSFKTGLLILAVGAIAGAVLGIALRPRPSVAAAHAPEAFPPPPTIVVPAPAPTVSMAVTAPPAAAREAREPRELRDVREGKPRHAKGHVKKGAEKGTPSEKDDGYRVASADPNVVREPAREPKKPPAKAAPATTTGKPGEDATNVLKAAMGSLENTL